MATIKLTENSMTKLFDKIKSRAALRHRINKKHQFNMDEIYIHDDTVDDFDSKSGLITIKATGIYIDNSVVIVSVDFPDVKNKENHYWHRIMICTNPGKRALVYAKCKMGDQSVKFNKINFNLVGKLED